MQIEILDIYENDMDRMLAAVSEGRREKALRMKNETVRRRSLAAAYLLDRMLEKYRPDVPTPAELSVDENGKPHLFLPDGGEVYFSLSHSGNYAACMLSDVPCGVDIERSDSRDYEKLLSHVCCEDENSRIACTEDFYRLWTLKEAAIKADGRGFAAGMNRFAVRTAEEDGVATEIPKEASGTCYDTEIDGRTYRGGAIPAPEGYLLSYMECV